MEKAAARNMELVGGIARRHAERDIRFEFALESLGNLATRDKLAFLAAEWAVIDTEHHVQRWFIDLDARHRIDVIGIANRVAKIDLAESDNQQDATAALCFCDGIYPRFKPAADQLIGAACNCEVLELRIW